MNRPYDPAIMMIPGLDLERFERLVYRRGATLDDYQNCGQELLNLLHQVRMGSGLFGFEPAHMTRMHTRLAGAISHLLIDPEFPLSDHAFLALIGFGPTLHMIFRASGYENLDHIINAVGDQQENGQLLFSNKAVLILLICWSLDSDMDLDIDHMFKESPQGTHAAIVSLLSNTSTVSEKAYARRVKLLARTDILDAHPLPVLLLNAASDAYMHCTYADVPYKHAIKPIINKWFRDSALKDGAVESTRKAVAKDRPTVVVCLEWFHIHHAIYRCYADALRQLKKRFRLVGIYRPNEADDEAVKLFHKAIPMSGQYVELRKLLEVINAEAPDIIFYPSLGMGPNYIAVSNLRLAPLQILAPGHPASSYSQAIDYIISDSDILGEPTNYTERCAGLDAGTFRFKPRIGFNAVRSLAMETVINIAIPAMASKLTPPFLSALMQIKAECPHVIYHFFPSMITMKHYVVTQELRAWFPDCEVYERSDYALYMANIGKCQLALDTFPFGGTNSSVDCLLLGIPIICLENDDATGRSTAQFLRRLKFGDDTCITHTSEEYVRAAIAYIKNQGWNIEPPSVETVEKELFGRRPEALQDAFLHAFERLWEEKVALDNP